MSKVPLPPDPHSELADALIEALPLADRAGESAMTLARDLARLRQTIARADAICRQIRGGAR